MQKSLRLKMIKNGLSRSPIEMKYKKISRVYPYIVYLFLLDNANRRKTATLNALSLGLEALIARYFRARIANITCCVRTRKYSISTREKGTTDPFHRKRTDERHRFVLVIACSSSEKNERHRFMGKNSIQLF